MRYQQIINELIWDDSHTSAAVAKKYPNDWIHFSNIQKIGINPKKGHADPPGIYFYPCRWLFTDDASTSQYGTTYPYYYIARLKPGAKVVNLGRITTDQTEAIAKKNGWFDDMQRIRKNPELLENEKQPMEKKLLRKAGGFFYACMDYLANIEHKSWVKMLQGIDAIIDPGFGFIYRAEPSQMIILNPRYMLVLAQGDNKDQSSKIYANLLKQVTEKYNGKFYFKNKNLVSEMVMDGNPVKIVFANTINRMYAYFFQEGFDVVNTEKIDDNHEATVEWMERTIKWATRGAEPKGLNLSWTYNKVIEVFKGIYPKANFFRNRIDKGLYHIWYVNDSRYFKIYLNSSIRKDDTVEFGISTDISLHINNQDHEIIVDFKKEYSKEDANDLPRIAKDMFDEMSRQIIAESKREKVPFDRMDKYLQHFDITLTR